MDCQIELDDINQESQVDYSKYKIISTFGKNMTGKSTLLNMILSTMTKNDKKIFGIEKTNELKMILYPQIIDEQHYLFVDVKGLKELDTPEEIKILLKLYLMSDIIIYNIESRFEKQDLIPFQILLSHLMKFNLSNHKSNLFINVCDCKFTNIKQQIDLVLDTKNDKFYSLMSCIKKLFNNIDGFSSKHLAKQLQGDNFIDFINENEMNDEINRLVTSINLSETNMREKIVENLNMIDQIDFNYYDGTLNYQKRMLEYSDEFHETLKQEMKDHKIKNRKSVTYTQTFFDEEIIPKELIYNEIKNKVITKFYYYDEETLKPILCELDRKLFSPLIELKQTFISSCDEYCKQRFEVINEDLQDNLCKNSKLYLSTNFNIDELTKTIDEYHTLFINELSDVYNDKKTEYITNTLSYYEKLLKFIKHDLLDHNKSILEKINSEISKFVNELNDQQILGNLSGIKITDLENVSTICSISETNLIKHVNNIVSNYKYRNIKFDDCQINYEELDIFDIYEDMEEYKFCLTKLNSKINSLTSNNEFIKELKVKKTEIIKEMIRSTCISSDKEIDSIIKSNPNIKFIIVKSTECKFVDNELYKINDGQLFIEDDFVDKFELSEQELKVISFETKCKNLCHVYVFDNGQSKTKLTTFFKEQNVKLSKTRLDVVVYLMEKIKTKVIKQYINNF